jgi:hypothetical protein
MAVIEGKIRDMTISTWPRLVWSGEEWGTKTNRKELGETPWQLRNFCRDLWLLPSVQSRICGEGEGQRADLGHHQPVIWASGTLCPALGQLHCLCPQPWFRDFSLSTYKYKPWTSSRLPSLFLNTGGDSLISNLHPGLLDVWISFRYGRLFLRLILYALLVSFCFPESFLV